MGRWLLGLLFCVWPLASMAGTNQFLLTVLPHSSISTPPTGYVPVSVDEGVALHATSLGGGMWVPIPSGLVYLNYYKSIIHNDGTWTWMGTLSDAPNAPKAVITFGDHAVFGTIPASSGQLFVLTTLQGKTWLADSRETLTATEGPHPEILRSSDLTLQANRTLRLAMAAAASPAEATPDNPATVDLLVVYTPEFVTQFGSLPAAIAFIESQLDKTNQAFSDSQVYGRIRLVKTAQTTISDSVDSVTALTNLQSNAAVAALRNQYGADVVAMAESTIGGCRGAGIQLGANLTPIPLGPSGPAYLVWGDDGTGACDAGIPGYGLAANLGSVFGLAMQPGVPTGWPGAYAFSYAYQKPGTSGPAQGTLEIGGVAIWPYFSNPNIDLCDGGACGVPDQSDAARSLNLTMPIIATFSPTKVVVHNDVNGDGKSDLLWFSPSPDCLSWWIMDGTTRVSHPVLGAPVGWKVVATGDFDGDGRADIVWMDTAQNVYFWLSDGNGFTSQFVAHVAKGWTVVGSGDFDGDGKSDLLWYNPAWSQISWWLMDGAAILSHPTQVVNSNWRVATTGDFHGDGKSDIVWTDASNNVYFSSLSGSSFASAFVARVASSWAIVGSGDVDGDGKADLFWHNASSSWFSWWLMNGTTMLSHPVQAVNVGWHVAATGDFDGEGNTGVVWADSKNNVYLWRLSGSSYTSQTVGSASAAWSLVP